VRASVATDELEVEFIYFLFAVRGKRFSFFFVYLPSPFLYGKKKQEEGEKKKAPLWDCPNGAEK
jgi:hypothetical protein